MSDDESNSRNLIGNVHPLEEPHDDQSNLRNARRLRQNRNSNTLREEPFINNVDITMGNISVVRSHTVGVMQKQSFNPRSELISLNDLITHGSRHGTNIVLIILAISSTSSNSSGTNVQQRYNGNRGQVNSVRHDRRLVVMCPLSPPGLNTAVILLGCGSCDRFFDRDISLRDNGSIRMFKIKFLLFFIYFFSNIFFYFILYNYLFNRSGIYDYPTKSTWN